MNFFSPAFCKTLPGKRLNYPLKERKEKREKVILIVPIRSHVGKSAVRRRSI